LNYRISNVLAWAGFTFAPIFLFLVFAASIELIPQKTPPENCEICQLLTWDDIYNSANLKRKRAVAGDWVLLNENTLKPERLVRSRPVWVVNFEDFRNDFVQEYEDIFLPHASLWLLASVINYVMMGSLRILPWRKIRQGGNGK